MITLKQWFYRHTKLPLLATLAGIFLVSTAYVVIWEIHFHHEQTKSAERLVSLASLSIIQRNRPLIESIMHHGYYELKAKKIALCRGSEVIIAYPYRTEACNSKPQGITTRSIEIHPAGMFDYRFLFDVPFISNSSLVFLILGISGILLLGTGFAFRSVFRRINEDLLRPLGPETDNNIPLEIKELENIRQRHKSFESLRTQQAITKAIAKRNRQVAHDIRDPVSALDKFVLAIPQIPREVRTLMGEAISRIKDIANDLLDSKIVQPNSLEIENIKSSGSKSLQTEMLYTLVSPIVSEKRTQFKDKSEIEIKCSIDSSWYGCFVTIDQTEFKRLLSNLLTNAIQAIESNGKVEISLTRKDGNCLLRIEDNGKGIPADILPLLGREGFTYGKQDGQGLGLFHAMNCTRSWRGSLSIHSSVGSGTVVEIILPIAHSPPWFKSELVISNDDKIMVLDDEPFVIAMWKKRFPGKEIHYFQNPSSFEGWCSSNDLSSTIFLCDFDLRMENEDGLKVIERLGIKDRSVLVTGLYNEMQIRERCMNLGMQIIPKELISYTPISFKNSREFPEIVNLMNSATH